MDSPCQVLFENGTRGCCLMPYISSSHRTTTTINLFFLNLTSRDHVWSPRQHLDHFGIGSCIQTFYACKQTKGVSQCLKHTERPFPIHLLSTLPETKTGGVERLLCKKFTTSHKTQWFNLNSEDVLSRYSFTQLECSEGLML